MIWSDDYLIKETVATNNENVFNNWGCLQKNNKSLALRKTVFGKLGSLSKKFIFKFLLLVKTKEIF